MDAILFYGEGSRSDASRRQVRSAAAQHSHRIGPRKPKSSKKPRSHSDDAPQLHHQKRRSLKANTLITEPSVPTGAAVGQAGKLAVAPAHSYQHPHPHPQPHHPYPHHPPPPAPAPAPPPPPQQAATSPARASAVAALPSASEHIPNVTPIPLAIDAPASRLTSGAPDRELELKRQAAQARFHEIQAIQRQHDAQAAERVKQQPPPPPQSHHTPHHQHSHATLPPLQVPAPPPLVIERIQPQSQQFNAAPSAHSRNNSQASPQSPSMRLPQYSWTEYPRYGLGHNYYPLSLQMLANAAVADRDATETRSFPTSSDIPGFRHFGAPAQQPPQQNPPSSPSQSGRPHEASLRTDRLPAPTMPEPGPQLAPLAVPSLTESSPLPASSLFEQTLQCGISGQERVDGEVRAGISRASFDE